MATVATAAHNQLNPKSILPTPTMVLCHDQRAQFCCMKPDTPSWMHSHRHHSGRLIEAAVGAGRHTAPEERGHSTRRVRVSRARMRVLSGSCFGGLSRKSDSPERTRDPRNPEASCGQSGHVLQHILSALFIVIHDLQGLRAPDVRSGCFLSKTLARSNRILKPCQGTSPKK